MAFATAARPAALFAALALTAASAAQAPAAFVEDFSTFASDPGTRNLAGPEANTNGWTFNNANRFTVESGGVAQNGGGGTINEKTAGKAHGLDLAGVSRVDLTFDIALKDAAGPSIGQFWLSDDNQNGYGITVERDANGNSLFISKFHGGTGAFGNFRNTTEARSADSAAYLPAGAGISLETLHLTIERTGDEVVLTAWSEGIPASSYDAPLVRVVDTGNAGPFNSAVLDLADLDHAAFALSRYYSTGGGARIDNINIGIVPEPASAALLGLGSAFVLSRSRTAN